MCIRDSQKGFARRIRQLPANDPAYFGQFIHQILFIVEASGRIDQQYISSLGFKGGCRIKDHGSRIGALALFYDCLLYTSTPGMNRLMQSISTMAGSSPPVRT